MSRSRKAKYPNGQVMCEGFSLNGKFHREDGPAFIHYYDDGRVSYQTYYINGIHHRDDGPAFTSYNKDGSLSCEHYYLNGERLSKEDWRKKLSEK